ncbi:MAG: class A beta-lactamase-related serine hydrolase [Acidobacteriota bacterium]|nr:class A beta-lactamase-related serine hydrolase [Acidobacteriota bacterium]
MQTLLEKAVAETISEYAAKKVSANDIAATLIDLRDVKNPQSASVRGDARIYPASVVKLFYLVAAHQWLENGIIKDSPEFERGLRNMIVDSSNDATDYVLDVLTDTGSGGELAAKDLKTFGDKRNVVNRYFAALGFTNINVNQKTYYEDAYGRERQFRFDGANRNMLTTGATARLLAEIVTGKAVTPERSRMMMDLLKRDFSGISDDADDQAHGFSAIALNKLNLKDAKLWSKAGWTSKTRHDAAYIETADGRKFVLVVFTENFAGERDIIPSITERVLKGLEENK